MEQDALSAAVARITNYIEADLCFPMDPEDKVAVRLVLTALEERTRERREEAGKHIDAKQLLAAAQDRITALETLLREAFPSVRIDRDVAVEQGHKGTEPLLQDLVKRIDAALEGSE